MFRCWAGAGARGGRTRKIPGNMTSHFQFSLWSLLVLWCNLRVMPATGGQGAPLASDFVNPWINSAQLCSCSRDVLAHSHSWAAGEGPGLSTQTRESGASAVASSVTASISAWKPCIFPEGALNRVWEVYIPVSIPTPTPPAQFCGLFEEDSGRGWRQEGTELGLCD